MNFDCPRQRKTDSTWAYTTANDRDNFARPIGYCAPFKEWSDEAVKLIFGDQDRYEEYIAPHRQAAEEGKYHDGGHATPEEARACYKTYLLDFDLRFRPDQEDANELHRCEAPDCKAYTSGMAEIVGMIGRHWSLCPEHRTREVVEGLFSVGDSWHS